MAQSHCHQVYNSGSELQPMHVVDGDSWSGSGDESADEPAINLDEDTPPVLMNFNRPRNRTQLRHDNVQGNSLRFDCSAGDDEDILVAPTPPEWLRRLSSQGPSTNPQLRLTRGRAEGSWSGPTSSMRVNQTAIRYSGPLSSGKPRRHELLPKDQPSTRMPQSRGSGRLLSPNIFSPAQGGLPSEDQPSSRELEDITNNSSPGESCMSPESRSPAVKRARQSGAWTDEQLKRAMRAVEEGMRMQTASELYRIPTSSLHDHLYGVTRSRKRGGKCVLTAKEEELVVNWILRLQELGHPITTAALRMKVAEICQERVTPFTNGIPGRGWLRWWRHRHPELSLRVAQGLETSRARGLCKENVQSFYQNLKQLYDPGAYSPNRVWNCDETGAQAGRNGGALVLARRGVRTVHQVMPDEREWLSVLVCVNAAGYSIPSFYIFKGKRFQKNYIQQCESGATMAMQPRAWMTSFLFAKWISHFVKSVEQSGGVSAERRHLLIFDGHCSHVSIDTVQAARRQGIDLLTLPSHTSHAMQPLDVCLFKPFKVAFKAYRDYWTYKSTGSSAKKENLAQWVSLALKRALTTENILKGFMVTGIWPWNNSAMIAKMGPSLVYHTQAEECTGAFTQLRIEEIQSDVAVQEDPNAQHFFVHVDSEEELSGSDMHGMSEHEVDPIEDPVLSISQFLTLPEVTVARRQPRAQPLVDYSKSIILTSDSYVSLLEEKCARKEAAEKAKAERKQQREVDRKRREEEKLRELESKRSREQERALKKAFDQLWSPTAVSAYGQGLHDRIQSGVPPPPNSFRAPYLGFPPEICKGNQRLAIERRRAKRRKEDVSLLPALTALEWAHKPGAPLWSTIIPQQACDPRQLRSPDAANRFYLRPFEEVTASTFGAPLSPTCLEPPRGCLSSPLPKLMSPIAGVSSGDLENIEAPSQTSLNSPPFSQSNPLRITEQV